MPHAAPCTYSSGQLCTTSMHLLHTPRNFCTNQAPPHPHTTQHIWLKHCCTLHACRLLHMSPPAQVSHSSQMGHSMASRQRSRSPPGVSSVAPSLAAHGGTMEMWSSPMSMEQPSSITKVWNSMELDYRYLSQCGPKEPLQPLGSKGLEW